MIGLITYFILIWLPLEDFSRFSKDVVILMLGNDISKDEDYK